MYNELARIEAQQQNIMQQLAVVKRERCGCNYFSSAGVGRVQ